MRGVYVVNHNPYARLNPVGSDIVLDPIDAVNDPSTSLNLELNARLILASPSVIKSGI